MSGCGDSSVNPYSTSFISLEIGREAWRSTRAIDATGPTGPTGVVQNMANPTGPYAAIVEGSFCGSSLPSLSVRTVLGFNAFNPDWRRWDYRDGILEISTLATHDLTRRAWIKAEIVPFVEYATYPGQPSASRLGPLTIRNSDVNDAPLIEPVGNILTQRTMLTPWDFLDTSPVASNNFYLGGPVRLSAGYNNTTTHDFYDVSAAVAFPSDMEFVPKGNSTVDLKIGAFESGTGADANLLSVAAMGFINGAPFVFPISVPRTELFNDNESVSDSSRYNAIRLEFDKTRMVSQSIANNKIVPPPITSAFCRPIIGADRTDVIVPAAATGTTTPKPLTSAVVYQDPRQLWDFVGIYGESVEYANDFTYVFANAAEHMRPDKHDRAAARLLTGPTWHERNIVRYGTALSASNSLHKFRLTCDWTPPEPSTYITCGLETFLDSTFRWIFECNPPFKIIGGADLEFLPIVAGRRLMPGQYATAPLEMPTISIENIPAIQTIYQVNSPSLIRDVTVPVSVNITPVVHGWAFSSVFETGSQTTRGPFGSPGVDGMALDDYNRWSISEQQNPLVLRTAGGRLDVLFEVWAKVSVTSINMASFAGESFNGEKTQYLKIRPPGNSDNADFYSRFTTFTLTDAQCFTLSNGDQISSVRRSPQAALRLYGTDPSDVSYSLRFSIP